MAMPIFEIGESYLIEYLKDTETETGAAEWCRANGAVANYFNDNGVNKFTIVARSSTEQTCDDRICEIKGLLLETEWYVHRFLEEAIAIPEGIQATRNALRRELETLL